MKRRIVIGSLIVVVLAGLAWLLLGRPEPEPVYQGKTLSTWLTNYGAPAVMTRTTYVNGKTRYEFSAPAWDQADIAIRAMGTNAIPRLLHFLRQQDSALKLRLFDLSQRQHIFKIDFVPAWSRKPCVQMAFHALGAQGQPAVPGLIEVYEHAPDSLSRPIAANALGQIGPAASNAIPVLSRGATNFGEGLGFGNDSLVALGQIGGNSLVVPVLIQILKQPSGPAPIDAISMLSRIDNTDAKPAASALFEFLKTLNNDPKKFREHLPSGNLNDMNNSICRLIQQIDPEFSERRQNEIIAYMHAGESP